jgi:hypothetical protein
MAHLSLEADEKRRTPMAQTNPPATMPRDLIHVNGMEIFVNSCGFPIPQQLQSLSGRFAILDAP